MLRGRATTGGIRHGRGQHRLCPGSLRLRVRQGREIVALHFAYAFGDTAPYAHGVCQRSVCIAAANSLSSAPIPCCTLCPDKSELPCPPVSSCLRLSPTPYASPLIAIAPTSGEIGAAEKSKSASGILTFTVAISPHIGSVSVHITQRKTRSERSCSIGRWGGIRAVHGALPRTP